MLISFWLLIQTGLRLQSSDVNAVQCGMLQPMLVKDILHQVKLSLFLCAGVELRKLRPTFD
jgi:hypothetical protein